MRFSSTLVSDFNFFLLGFNWPFFDRNGKHESLSSIVLGFVLF